MIKIRPLLLETVELLDDGNLRLSSVSDLSKDQLAKISRLMSQKGYDSRGADDAARAINNFLSNPHNPAPDILDKDVYGAWVDTIATVLKLHKQQPDVKTTYNTSKVIQKAKRTFGVTTNLSTAGYILPDGSLLNLSQDGLTRGLDHREIAYIYSSMGIKIGKDEEERQSPTTYMRAFMDDCHAIRIGGSQSTVDLAYIPSRQQADQLLKLFSMYDGAIQLDVRSRKYGRDARQYSRGTPAKVILRDIVEFYSSGEFPPQNVRHSNDLKENEEPEESVDRDRLIYNDNYLEQVAEQLGYNNDFTAKFWSIPHLPMLYHCTTPESYELIKVEGLKKRKERRGAVSNRHIGPAVFSTMYEEEVPFFSRYYGNIVIGINTQQMKADGFMPIVEQEPDWTRAKMLEFVLRKLGEEDAEAAAYVDSSDQNTEGTVILYANIPLKYLSLQDNL